MPLYEYQCERCERRFEVIQKFSDPKVETCSVCGGPVRKLLSSPAIQFKGSGWYITDYARKGQTDGTSSTSNSASKPENSNSSGSSAPNSSSGSDAASKSPASDPAPTSSAAAAGSSSKSS